MTKRAVIVGVNDYSVQGYNNLNYCVSDAASMYHMLKDAFAFDPADMFYLTDASATSSRIRQTLRYVLSQSQPGDVVCFFYAGHGGRSPHPSVPGQMFETVIPFSGQHISDHELFSAADALDPSVCNFTVILDSCHSGGMHEESEAAIRARSPNFTPALVDQLQACRTLVPCGICLPPQSRSALDGNVRSAQAVGAGVVVEEDASRRLVQQAKSTLIAASSAAQTAQEHPSFGHGLLTKAFLDIVDASDFAIEHHGLIDALTERVSAMMAQHYPGESQSPQLRGQQNRMGETFLAGFNASR